MQNLYMDIKYTVNDIKYYIMNIGYTMNFIVYNNYDNVVRLVLINLNRIQIS